jgi:DNA (cytosine-5)-methyltransferase 1
MYGLDLFSGIGGITRALQEYVLPVAYVEKDAYCQGVLLSRMSDGSLPIAPIWDDITTLQSIQLPCGGIDIIYGGFPCQNISVAGKGEGLEGKQSGLFYEALRLVREIRPTFVFLENVPAIRSRGAGIVTAELARLWYDCRWITLSASSIGANHERKRWFLLAYTGTSRRRLWEESIKAWQEATRGSEEMANAATSQLHETRERNNIGRRSSNRFDDQGWWEIEPQVGRVVDGLPRRVDRIKSLGNSVVPQQAKAAFEILMFGKSK